MFALAILAPAGALLFPKSTEMAAIADKADLTPLSQLLVCLQCPVWACTFTQ